MIDLLYDIIIYEKSPERMWGDLPHISHCI
jgi:hypothetical protein